MTRNAQPPVFGPSAAPVGTARRRLRHRSRRALSCVLPALVAAGCGVAAEPPPLEGLRELSAPVGPGSGEVHLEPRGDGVIMSWLEPDETGGADGGYALRMARLRDGAWDAPVTVARSQGFFVNWADFPSVTPMDDGRLVAHWLERGSAGGYDYGIRVAWSGDDGRSWSEPWTPHEDGTPQEHGFVTLFPFGDGGMGLVWLDGRDYEAHARAAGRGAPTGDGPDEPGTTGTDAELVPSAAGPQMALRFRATDADGAPAGPSVPLDARVCDCCQTDAARTADGVLVAYRDRSGEEVRDISVVRFDGSAWSEPEAVHRDEWVIGGCPVNGPAVSASGSEVVVAWFTAAEDVPRVRVAFSGDGGRSFGPAIEVDEGNPAGRTDVELLDDGSALVSWLERGGGEEDEAARILVRRVRSDGSTGPVSEVAASSSSRASGFPQLVQTAPNEVIVAWTDVGEDRVRVARAGISR